MNTDDLIYQDPIFFPNQSSKLGASDMFRLTFSGARLLFTIRSWVFSVLGIWE